MCLEEHGVYKLLPRKIGEQQDVDGLNNYQIKLVSSNNDQSTRTYELSRIYIDQKKKAATDIH